MRPKITFYDHADLNYSSFYLSGLMQLQERWGYRFGVEQTMSSAYKAATVSDTWRQARDSIALYSVDAGGQQQLFCIDARDSATLESGMGYYLPLLEIVDHYFKVNHNPVAVEEEPQLQQYAHKISAVPPICPIRPQSSWPLLPFPRSIRTGMQSWRRARRRIRRLSQLCTVDQLAAFRTHPRDLDVFFMMTYYDQDHHVQTTQLRARLVRALRERTDLHVVAGLVSNKPLSGDLADLQMAPLSYPDYLRNLARARIVIYIRGVHDCHSFKLPEYLAMGKPIVGQRLLNNADTLYANAHFDEQFAFEEAAEIVDTVARRLADPPWLDAISAANAHTFDEEIGPTPGAELILQKIGIAIDPRHT